MIYGNTERNEGMNWRKGKGINKGVKEWMKKWMEK